MILGATRFDGIKVIDKSDAEKKYEKGKNMLRRRFLHCATYGVDLQHIIQQLSICSTSRVVFTLRHPGHTDKKKEGRSRGKNVRRQLR